MTPSRPDGHDRLPIEPVPVYVGPAPGRAAPGYTRPVRVPPVLLPTPVPADPTYAAPGSGVHTAPDAAPVRDRPGRGNTGHAGRGARAAGHGRAALREPVDDPLLTAKLTVPVYPGGLVSRQRLHDALTEGTRGPLTVVTGPAGAGKTALAASWALSADPPGPVAWVSLDACDRPGTLWAYVLGALRRAGVALRPDIGGPLSAEGVDHSLLVRLAASFDGQPAPAVLVLDGVDRPAAPDLAEGLRFLVEHTGPDLRLVLLGRAAPPLPLARYRAERRVHEIPGRDLAFTAAEAAELLAGRRTGHGSGEGGGGGRERGREASADRETATALVRRTEGWAAGLRLCALAMDGYDDPAAFTGSRRAAEHAVADYLLAEVFDTQPGPTRELLLCTGLFGQVHPDLADVLTHRRDAARVLEALARAHAFVEPVGDTGWYRFHPLFAGVLRTRLRGSRPDALPGLYRRAARWLAGCGRGTGVPEHAAAAGDRPAAAAPGLRGLPVGHRLEGDGTGILVDLFAGRPSDAEGTGPALAAAARSLGAGDPAACRAWLDRAEDGMRRAEDRPGSPAEAEPAERLVLALLRLLSGPHGHTDGAAGPDAGPAAGPVSGLAAGPALGLAAGPDRQSSAARSVEEPGAVDRVAAHPSASRPVSAVPSAGPPSPASGDASAAAGGRASGGVVAGGLVGGDQAFIDRPPSPPSRSSSASGAAAAGSGGRPGRGAGAAGRAAPAPSGRWRHGAGPAGPTAPAGGSGGGSAPGARSGSAPVWPVLVEELSARERQVLAQVARLMSTDEIAAELGLSVNTVKTHLRSIFHKLGVSRRRDAVERARELQIL
ncbi:LuxR C-terminal-related transcriptional regulator [Streptomyces sp. NPDC086023]|uniref:LuxR C-terminal-related transcriptional regulator n=1 Tax=Streptomyces sp. NPDC086023 TaxID=3365746 RepID=UPI0037D67D9B